MLLDALSREDISVALGYSSIFAWLFAQMPQVSCSAAIARAECSANICIRQQVYKNYMDSSVEGELEGLRRNSGEQEAADAVRERGGSFGAELQSRGLPSRSRWVSRRSYRG